MNQKNLTDIFGMTGDSISWATLHLSLRAYLLMREEHPLSIPYIEKTEDGYVFHGPFSNFEGISRFILGLIDEIRIQHPPSLKEFVERKIGDRYPLSVIR
jgi:proteasome accessory factor C